MLKKELGRIKRHGRIRKKLLGTAERPRLSVRRSLKNIYVQVIDDMAQKTLLSFSTRDKEFLKTKSVKGKVNAAEALAAVFAPVLKQKGISKIAFDRGGYLYHGRVKAIADSLRKNGIDF